MKQLCFFERYLFLINMQQINVKVQIVNLRLFSPKKKKIKFKINECNEDKKNYNLTDKYVLCINVIIECSTTEQIE